MSTSSVVADLVADAQEFLDGGVVQLTELLEEVAAYGDRPVPTPSPELALLLAGRSAPTTARPDRPHAPRVRIRGMVAGLAAAAVSGLSLTGAAAVANELPVPIQRAVAHFSEQYLPFSFPRPNDDPPAGFGATSTRRDPDAPAPSAAPSAVPSAAPFAAPFGTPAGALTESRPRHPGTGRTGRHDRVQTTPKAGSPTSHRTGTPAAGRDGTQKHGTVPATSPRKDPSVGPAGTSHDPAAGGGLPHPTPGTRDTPRTDPKGHADHGAAHVPQGGKGTRPSGQGGGSDKPPGTDRGPAKNQRAGDLTTADASGAPDATKPAKPDKPDKDPGSSGGHAHGTQDGSGAATP